MHGSLPTELLLNAYREGIFPMAEDASDFNFAFYKPVMRAIVPIEGLHISHSLIKTIRRRPFRVSRNEAFERVIDACAQPRMERESTWINRPIRDFFIQLHQEGHAHSIECWDENGTLAGGLYGLAIGAVFCGESMFSYQTDASKVALVHLCALLWKSGFTTLDSQFINDHMKQFGTYEIPQEEYEDLIHVEMTKFRVLPDTDLAEVTQEYLARRG